MPTEATGRRELLANVNRIRAELSRTWYDEEKDRMRTSTPDINLMLNTGMGYQDPSVKIKVNMTGLNNYLNQLDKELEIFCNRARKWMSNVRYEFAMYHGNYSGSSIDIKTDFKFDDHRLSKDGLCYGHIDQDTGEEVIWEKN